MIAFQSFLKLSIQIAMSHHERWDGKGYPEGMSGVNIPLSARIMALADVYDALRTDRYYKVAFSHEKAGEIIAEESGKHFDPTIVKIFLKNETAFTEIAEKMPDRVTKSS